MVNNYIYKFLSIVKPTYRRLILLILDSIIFNISIFITLSIFKDNVDSFHDDIYIYIYLTLIGLFIYSFSGQYKGLTRYVGSSSYTFDLKKFSHYSNNIIFGIYI